MRHKLPLLLLLAALAAPGHAQLWQRWTNPDVQVTLTHPPALGIKIKRLAFSPVSDRLTEDLVSACISELTKNEQLEVLDRNSLEKVIREQKLGSSGLLDEATAVAMGRLLGAPVLLVLKVQERNIKHTLTQNTSPGGTDRKGNYTPPVTTYYAQTMVEYNASAQAIDLATGRVYNQKRIVCNPNKTNSANQGAPPYPADSEVTEMAITQARDQIAHMILPWTEPKKLIFYNDKDYGMKIAYQRLQLDDAKGALEKSLAALEAAKADPKVNPKYVGRTNYNMGMSHFILGDPQAALPFFRAARETDPDNGIFKESTDNCVQSIKLLEEMSKVDTRTRQEVKLELPAGLFKPAAAESTAAPRKAKGKAKGAAKP